MERRRATTMLEALGTGLFGDNDAKLDAGLGHHKQPNHHYISICQSWCFIRSFSMFVVSLRRSMCSEHLISSALILGSHGR